MGRQIGQAEQMSTQALKEEEGDGEASRAANSTTKDPVELPSNIVHEYLAELPANPYHLETLQPVVDHLMESPEKIKYIPYRPMVIDEGVVTTPRQSSDQLREVREADLQMSRLDRAPNRKLEGLAEDWPLKRAATEPASTASKASFAQREARLRASREDPGKLLAKTDSGYSSDISLRSVHELPATETDREGRPALPRRSSSVDAQERQRSLSRPIVPQKAPPPVPEKTPSPRWSMETTGTPPVPPKPHDSYQAKRMSVHVGDAPDQESAQPPPLPRKDSWWQLGSKGSSKTTRGRSPGRRLQKPMPTSVARKHGIVIHGDEIELPLVPSEAATKSTNQLETMESTLVRSKTSPEISGNARPTSIVADDSSPPQADEPKPSRPNDGSSRRRRSSIGAVLPALRRRLSSVSGGLLAGDTTAMRVDHDTALDSLGASPYDAASGSSRRKSQEMTRRMHKTKSMVEMSSSNSSKKEELREKRDSSTTRASSRPRPHSFHSSEVIPQIDGLKKSRRPKSVVVRDAPPVPSLPAIHLQDLESGSSSNLLAPPKPPRKENSVTNGKKVETNDRLGKKMGEETTPPARSAVKRRQETSSRSTMPLNGSPKGKSAGSSKTSSFARLQRTHGLDLRDVPISVPV